MNKTNGRNANGRFAFGNAGGPGRPRRVVEREYLSALADAVPLETWKEVVDSAVAAAKDGDAKARDWLTRHLIGEKPPSLLKIQAEEIVSEGENLPLLLAIANAIKTISVDELFHHQELSKAKQLLNSSAIDQPTKNPSETK